MELLFWREIENIGKWLLSTAGIWIQIITGLLVFANRWYHLKRKWIGTRIWFDHKKAKKEQWQHDIRNAQTQILKRLQNQDEREVEQNVKIDKIIGQVFPNGGNSMFDKVEKVLHNQSITKGTLDAMLYLDDVPTFKCDMHGNCFFVNAAWLQLLGFNNPEDAYGEGWLRTIHPPEKEIVRREFQAAIKSETQYVSEVNKINITDKSVIPVKMVTRIVRDEVDNPIEIVGQLKLKK